MRVFRRICSLFSALAFAAVLAVTVDLATAAFGFAIPFVSFGLIFAITAAVLIIFRLRTDRFWFIWFCLLLIAAFILGFLLFNFYSKGDYAVEDNGKAQLYGGRNVLLLSPHEDDELLMAGGVLEEYVKYGSKVKLAFLTNGDASTAAEVRINEALNAAAALGVSKENVYFLGYGDHMVSGVHIYNLPDDVAVTSQAGYSSTYALPQLPAYHQGQAYTKANMRSDIKDLILELKPDTIICAEVELHPDHSGLSLLLDEAMAEILRQDDSYQPIILKSSCYATGFYAVEDFYALNLESTQLPNSENFLGMYRWEDRLRLPVNGSGLSRSIFGCDTFEHLRLHKSQKIQIKAEGTINSDKVFWLRDTSSICYDAQIETSSGYAKFLNDFKLYDNFDVYGNYTNIRDNTWVPDESDSEKRVSVTLAEPAYIQRICLYDDPGSESNVLNARISFDDGSSIETGRLNDTGSTEILVNKENVQSFTVEILDSRGDHAGLTEIEAYSQQLDYGFDFIKLTDMQGDFVYDYFIDEKGSEQFLIHAPGVDSEFNILCDNSRCTVKYEDGIVTIKCPKNESCNITVSSKDGQYSDTVHISNPGRFMRETGPYFESLVRQFTRVNMQQSNTYLLLRSVYRLIA